MTSLHENQDFEFFDKVHITSHSSISLEDQISIPDELIIESFDQNPLKDAILEDGVNKFNNSELCRILKYFEHEEYMVMTNLKLGGQNWFQDTVGPFLLGNEIQLVDRNNQILRVIFHKITCHEEKVSGVLRMYPSTIKPHVAGRRMGLSTLTLSVKGKWNSSTGLLSMLGCLGPTLVRCDSGVLLYFPKSFSSKQRSLVFGSIFSLKSATNYFHPVFIGLEMLSPGLQDGGWYSRTYVSYNYTKGGLAIHFTGKIQEPPRLLSYITELIFWYPFVEEREFRTFNMSNHSGDDLKIDTFTSSETFVKVEVLSLGPIFKQNANLLNGGYNHELHNISMNLLIIEAPKKVKEESYRHVLRLYLEGVYDQRVGKLYLIGCKKVDFDHVDLERGLDCRIEVTIEYSPINIRWLINPSAKISIYMKKSHEPVPYISLLMPGFWILGYGITIIYNEEILIMSSETQGYKKHPYDLQNYKRYLKILDYLARFLVLVSMFQMGIIFVMVLKARKVLRAQDVSPPSEKKVITVSLICNMCYLLPRIIEGWIRLHLAEVTITRDDYVKLIVMAFWYTLGYLQDYYMIPQIVAHRIWKKPHLNDPLLKYFFTGLWIPALLQFVYEAVRNPVVAPFDIVLKIAFFWVDDFACPASFPWHNAKHVIRDPFPVAADINAQDYATLVAHPSPFRKFSEAFMCLVGLSRHYLLDEETYPRFVHKNREDMDLFDFIHVSDPTKVRILERERNEDEPRLLETTVGRIIPLLPVAPDDETRGFHEGGQDANIQTIVEAADMTVKDAAPVQLRHQGKRKFVVVDTSGASHPPKKIEGDHGTPSEASVGGKSHSALQRLLAGAMLNVEVGVTTAHTLPFMIAFVSTTPEREDEDHTDVVAEPNLCTIGAPQSDFLVGGILTVINPESDLQKTYVPQWSVTNVSCLDDGRVCRETVDKFAPSKFFASVRGMEHDQLFTEFNAIDEEIGNLKARMLLKEEEAAEAIRLHVEASNFETMEKSLWDEVNALKERYTILEKERNALDVKAADLEASAMDKERKLTNLNVLLTAVKSQNDILVDHVQRLEEFQDAQLKIVNDKFDKLWLLTHGMELALVNCLHSPEYLSALGVAVGKAIEKEMQDGLSTRIIHGKEGRVLTGSEGTSNVMPSTADTTTTFSTTLASSSTIAPNFVDDYEVMGTDDQAGAGGNAEPFLNVDDAKLNIPQ
uniref:RING-type E3 ubiquitin transferase n=1 Tax=Tanacetum cinerariifolium TaxID=118510 RepID=A0A6L2KAJ9_TANCI|nr:nucleolar protein [Tanacetum cinerariifolium]